MNEITLEQALNNIEAVLVNFQGTRAQHVALEQSFTKIKEELAKKKEA